jgi:hypothetical protein
VLSGDILMQDGYTALALTSYNGHTQVVHVLLNAGASPDIQGQVKLPLCDVCMWCVCVCVCVCTCMLRAGNIMYNIM